MSHGPSGLGGGTLGPAPACSAIVSVAPISVSASASISTRSILVFMFILFASPGLFRHLAPRAWMLRQRLSSLSHPASDTVVSGIIRDFYFELPGTVQYILTRYFSTRKSAP